MSRIVRQGPPEPDPLEELRDEVRNLCSEVTELNGTVTSNHTEITRLLQEILDELRMKSDRD